MVDETGIRNVLIAPNDEFSCRTQVISEAVMSALRSFDCSIRKRAMTALANLNSEYSGYTSHTILDDRTAKAVAVVNGFLVTYQNDETTNYVLFISSVSDLDDGGDDDPDNPGPGTTAPIVLDRDRAAAGVLECHFYTKRLISAVERRASGSGCVLVFEEFSNLTKIREYLIFVVENEMIQITPQNLVLRDYLDTFVDVPNDQELELSKLRKLERIISNHFLL